MCGIAARSYVASVAPSTRLSATYAEARSPGPRPLRCRGAEMSFRTKDMLGIEASQICETLHDTIRGRMPRTGGGNPHRPQT
jgi:hypothetical protein